MAGVANAAVSTIDGCASTTSRTLGWPTILPICLEKSATDDISPRSSAARSPIALEISGILSAKLSAGCTISSTAPTMIRINASTASAEASPLGKPIRHSASASGDMITPITTAARIGRKKLDAACSTNGRANMTASPSNRTMAESSRLVGAASASADASLADAAASS